ncbi:hypothetical protein OO009_01485 [Flavobacteriaceae bacterium KMM 6897]|nr:hypothetical protein [Flavobacteriaceae bacterium KMM 6897]
MKTKAYTMNPKKLLPYIIFVVLFSFLNIANAQIPPNAYTFESIKDGTTVTHLFLINKDYLVHTIYSKTPANFIKTIGGFYELKTDRIILNLEFNSEFKKDSITRINIPYTLKNEQLSLGFEGSQNKMNTAPIVQQDLDGKWLMAGRVTAEGENRRDTTRPRKTMKFLLNGYFQWIAFNTETMDFFGTGGGAFTSKDGTYSEHIQFFSRDNTRAGATLEFTYDKKDGDWHHMGKSSKGEPLHEIWSPRE